MSEVELFLIRHWDGTPEDLAACVSVLQAEARRPLEEALARCQTVLENIAEWAGDAWDADEGRDAPIGVSTIHCEAVDAAARVTAALAAAGTPS